MSIVTVFDIFFSLQGLLFCDKSKLHGQVTLRIIMNTKLYMILETLLDSFRMDKEILKDYKGIHIGVKGSLDSSTK